MANLFFLVLAIVLLLVAVFSLVSYIKDRKKQQFTFKKGVNNKATTGEARICELSKVNLT
jgi:predicted membrane protein